MWKGLGTLLSQNPTKQYVLRGALSALTVEDANKIFTELFPAFASTCGVESIANGVLIIRVKNSIGMQEMTLRKTLFQRTLKERGLEIRDIRVCLKYDRPNHDQPNSGSEDYDHDA